MLLPPGAATRRYRSTIPAGGCLPRAASPGGCRRIPGLAGREVIAGGRGHGVERPGRAAGAHARCGACRADRAAWRGRGSLCRWELADRPHVRVTCVPCHSGWPGQSACHRRADGRPGRDAGRARGCLFGPVREHVAVGEPRGGQPRGGQPRGGQPRGGQPRGGQHAPRGGERLRQLHADVHDPCRARYAPRGRHPGRPLRGGRRRRRGARRGRGAWRGLRGGGRGHRPAGPVERAARSHPARARDPPREGRATRGSGPVR
jgi:hypothetical protein